MDFLFTLFAYYVDLSNYYFFMFFFFLPQITLYALKSNCSYQISIRDDINLRDSASLQYHKSPKLLLFNR